MLVRSGFVPATSRSADRRSPNRVSQAAVTSTLTLFFFLKRLYAFFQILADEVQQTYHHFLSFSSCHDNIFVQKMPLHLFNLSWFIQKENNFPWSVLLSTIQMTSMFKNFHWNQWNGQWFHLSFEHFDVISMLDKKRPWKTVVDLLNTFTKWWIRILKQVCNSGQSNPTQPLLPFCEYTPRTRQPWMYIPPGGRSSNS